MILALAFGFLHLMPGLEIYNFERLHIFLFNLCTGGTLIIFFTENKNFLSIKAIMFFVLSVLFALLAFLKIYLPTIIIALLLATIVEYVRISKFSLFPTALLKLKVNTSSKFQQASLLCLSMGLIISALVIINNEFIHLLKNKKFVLDVFFLGFSFPISLITMRLYINMLQILYYHYTLLFNFMDGILQV